MRCAATVSQRQLPSTSLALFSTHSLTALAARRACSDGRRRDPYPGAFPSCSPPFSPRPPPVRPCASDPAIHQLRPLSPPASRSRPLRPPAGLPIPPATHTAPPPPDLPYAHCPHRSAAGYRAADRSPPAALPILRHAHTAPTPPPPDSPPWPLPAPRHRPIPQLDQGLQLQQPNPPPLAFVRFAALQRHPADVVSAVDCGRDRAAGAACILPNVLPLHTVPPHSALA